MSEINDVKFLVKLSQIVMNNTACDELGFDPYCVSKGTNGDTLIELTASQFKKFGFLEELYNTFKAL